MIALVQRYRRTGPLLRDLYEPGHPGPHLVAGAQEPASLEPERQQGSRNLSRLTGWLNEPLALLPPGSAGRTVWHCRVRAHPDDRPLTDHQWADIAADIMHRTGLAPRGDTRAVRWVAARHGQDHIHIIATLARQDGTWPAANRDAAMVRHACQAAEDRYGLRSTRLTGKKGSARCPGPAQLSCRDFPAPGTASAERAATAARRQPERATPRRRPGPASGRAAP